MKLIAFAEIIWPRPAEAFFRGSVICTPAKFEGERSNWSVWVALHPCEVRGNTTINAISPLVDGGDHTLLKLHRTFDLFCSPTAVAKSKIVRLQTVTDDDYTELFQLKRPRMASTSSG